MTNYERYFGTPEKCSIMEVHRDYWSKTVTVFQIKLEHAMEFKQYIARFESIEAYQAWLKAPFDDGTIKFED